MNPCFSDVRLALRDLLKAPGYSFAAIVVLALAIGANSAVFSAVHAVLLDPLPVRQPGNLVICWASDRSHDLAVVELSYRNFQDWATHSRSFSQAAAIGSSNWPAVLDGPGESVRLSSAGVSVSFFETLGVPPAIGRGFRPGDDLPGVPRVVVLSHRTWVSRFGGDPSAVGTTIQLDKPHTIVGVMPDGFEFPRGTDFWTPVVPILAELLISQETRRSGVFSREPKTGHPDLLTSSSKGARCNTMCNTQEGEPWQPAR